jgi:hypothetical protein
MLLQKDVDMKWDMTGHHGMQYISIIAILFSKLLMFGCVWRSQWRNPNEINAIPQVGTEQLSTHGIR